MSRRCLNRQRPTGSFVTGAVAGTAYAGRSNTVHSLRSVALGANPLRGDLQQRFASDPTPTPEVHTMTDKPSWPGLTVAPEDPSWTTPQPDPEADSPSADEPDPTSAAEDTHESTAESTIDALSTATPAE